MYRRSTWTYQTCFQHDSLRTAWSHPVAADTRQQLEPVLQEQVLSCTIQHRCCKTHTETAGERCSLVYAFTTMPRGTSRFSRSLRTCGNRILSCTNWSLPGSRSSKRARGMDSP